MSYRRKEDRESFTHDGLFAEVWAAWQAYKAGCNPNLGHLIRGSIKGKNVDHIATQLDGGQALSWGPGRRCGEFYIHPVAADYEPMADVNYLSPNEIVPRMLYAIAGYHKRGRYGAVISNCEHLGTWIACGKAYCWQVARCLCGLGGRSVVVNAKLDSTGAGFQSALKSWEDGWPLDFSSKLWTSRRVSGYSDLLTHASHKDLYEWYIATNGWGHGLSQEAMAARAFHEALSQF